MSRWTFNLGRSDIFALGAEDQGPPARADNIPEDFPKFFQEAGGGHYDARFYAGRVEDSVLATVLISMLKWFGSLCRSHGVRPILMHGALLGWYWNRRLLPWDDDIDLCLLYEDLVRLENARSTECISTSTYLLEVNPAHINHCTLNRHPGDLREPNKIDARVIDPTTGLFIDITALRLAEDRLLWTKCPHVYPWDWIFPLNASYLEGVEALVPAQPKRVLDQEYGARATETPSYNGWTFDGDTWHPI